VSQDRKLPYAEARIVPIAHGPEHLFKPSVQWTTLGSFFGDVSVRV